MSEGAGHCCIRAEVAAASTAERVMAEAWAAGASGAEERGASQGVLLLIYAPTRSAAAVEAAVRKAAGAAARIDRAEPVDPVDWANVWRAGLEPIEISERLVVRPSFTHFDRAAGQAELVVDPGLAFGTGGHASTRLALEWICLLCPELAPRARVLDVGTGTGVLALAALRLGADRALGLDIDPVAVREARVWARTNGLSERLALMAGPLSALRAQRFELVVANLLSRELLPLAGGLARHCRSGGWLVVSGLLETQAEEVEAVLCRHGFDAARRRVRHDPTGDRWAALALRRS